VSTDQSTTRAGQSAPPGELREEVRARYAALAQQVTTGQTAPGLCGCGQPDDCGCGSGRCGGAARLTEEEPGLGAKLYSDHERGELPDAAVLASLGCGNPTAVAELREGETVLDLGSGGGIDVLLSARRVGPTGTAYGLDMTEEMLALARRNAAEAGATNVHFLKGHIEAIPLPAGSIDVVISNCVINLSTDKPRVLAEAFRVLRPGGRLGVSDVIAGEGTGPDQLADAERRVGCVSGALTRGQYSGLLRAAGFTGVTITLTHQAGAGLHSAIIQAAKPAAQPPAPGR